MDTSTIVIQNQNHGSFTVSTTEYYRWMVAHGHNLNCDSLTLAAFVTKTFGIDYFDCDTVTCLAVAASAGLSIEDYIEFSMMTTGNEIDEIRETFKGE